LREPLDRVQHAHARKPGNTLIDAGSDRVEVPDVTGHRLTDLVENRDPALLAAVALLLAELPDPAETTTGWPNFMEPFEPTGSRPRRSTG
jgi:hypothetical protein